MTSPQVLTATPNFGYLPLEVSFSIYAPDLEPITSTNWYFGDGTGTETVEGSTNTHLYDNGADPAFLVEVYTYNGETQTGYLTTTVGTQYPPDPTVAIEYTIDPSPLPISVQFSAEIYSVILPVVMIYWDFGDGMDVTFMGDGTKKDAVSPVWTYNNAGTYTVTCNVAFSDGSYFGATQDIVLKPTMIGAGGDNMGTALYAYSGYAPQP